MDQQKRESDKIIYQLVQQLQDFREIDADWKVRHDSSAQEFRLSITGDVKAVKDDVSRLMIPYKIFTWVVGLIAVELGVRLVGVVIDLFKGHLKG